MEVERRAPSRAIVRWRFLAIGMYSVGALSVELLMALSLGDTGSAWIGHGAALLFLALGLTTGLTAMRHYRPIVLVNVIGSILIVSALLIWAPALEGIETFYLWPLLGAAYLLRRREVVGIGVLTLAAYGGALDTARTTFPTGTFLVVGVASTGVVISVRILAEQLHRLVRALHTSSSTDPLTGLLNRRSFDRRFAVTFQHALQEALPLSVLLLDLDHFKQVNDERGHETGDRRWCASRRSSRRRAALAISSHGSAARSLRWCWPERRCSRRRSAPNSLRRCCALIAPSTISSSRSRLA